MRLSASAQAILEALRELGGEAGAGELAAATDIPSRTVTDALKALRDAELVESAKGAKGRVRLTVSGRQHLLSAAPISAGAVVDEALDLWAGLGLYAHRAFLELLLSATVGRHHIGAGRPNKHLVLATVGETGTGKTSLVEMACQILGLGELVQYRILVPSVKPGMVVGRLDRVEGGDYVWRPAPIASRPLALFDEFDKASEEVRRALMVYLDGTVPVQYEGQVFHLMPTPVLAANPPPRGPRYGHIPPEFRRRAAFLDTGYAEHRGDDIGDVMDAFTGGPRPHLDLSQLQLAPSLPAAAKQLLRSLKQALTPAGRTAAAPQPALEAAALGRAALAGDITEHGLLLAAYSVSVAYLTVTETIEDQVIPGWQLDFEAIREHLEGHGGVDKLQQVVAGARVARAQAHARVARARVADEVEDLELTGAKHELAERLRLAAEAIDGRRVPGPGDKATAAALRAQLRKARGEVLDCRSRGRLEDLRTVAAGPLEQAGTLRRRIDWEAEERSKAERDAVDARRQNRDDERQTERYKRAQERAQREVAKSRLRELREQVRPFEQLWNRRSVTPNQPPWKVLEGLGLLYFEPMTALEQPDSWWRRLGATILDGAGGGRWVRDAGDPRYAFSGTRTSCPQLAQWGAGTRAVLRPTLEALYAEEDQLVTFLKLRQRRRPDIYRREPPPPPVRVQSQRVPQAAALPLGLGSLTRPRA